MRIWLYKWRHWEYWPAYIVYFPCFVLWIYYAIRTRSLSFYKKVNPAFPNGGLYDVSKYIIYQCIPPEYYPKTIYVKIGDPTDFEQLLREQELNFPLILKPDRGKRGHKVCRVTDINELRAYHQLSDEDYLIQELVHYPLEVGIFYCRMPGSAQGRITGITGKQFMTVIGDGVSTIEQLMRRHMRYAMQVKRLHIVDPERMRQVLPEGVQCMLEPIGNHCRGTMFTDESFRISPEMEDTINRICTQVKGFYYGRLDIRFASWAELAAGKACSILEINGAMSEPAHIYDPSYSFWQGQKEIFRHQRLLLQIVKGSSKVG